MCYTTDMSDRAHTSDRPAPARVPAKAQADGKKRLEAFSTAANAKTWKHQISDSDADRFAARAIARSVPSGD